MYHKDGLSRFSFKHTRSIPCVSETASDGDADSAVEDALQDYITNASTGRRPAVPANTRETDSEIIIPDDTHDGGAEVHGRPSDDDDDIHDDDDDEGEEDGAADGREGADGEDDEVDDDAMMRGIARMQVALSKSLD